MNEFRFTLCQTHADDDADYWYNFIQQFHMKPDLWSFEWQAGMNKHLRQHHQPVVIATHHQITTAITHYTTNGTVAAATVLLLLLWAPAQCKRATMLYFANVFFIYFFYGRLILRPWLTEVRESFTRGGP